MGLEGGRVACFLDTTIEISVFHVYSVDGRATAMDAGRIWQAIYDLARDCHTTYGLTFSALSLQVFILIP